MHLPYKLFLHCLTFIIPTITATLLLSSSTRYIKHSAASVRMTNGKDGSAVCPKRKESSILQPADFASGKNYLNENPASLSMRDLSGSATDSTFIILPGG